MSSLLPATYPDASSTLIHVPSDQPAPARDDPGRSRGAAPESPDGAWARFHARVEVEARRAARRRGLDPDDAAQEAWLAVLAHLARFRYRDDRPDGLIAWASVVVRRRLARVARIESRRAARFGATPDSELLDPAAGPAEASDRAEARAAVRSALARAGELLPEASHRVLTLRCLEGRPFAEIGEALGLSPAQARDRHRRCLPVLRRMLCRLDDGRPPTRPPISPTS